MASTVWLAPGAESISEFARQHSGVYLHATCVETAALDCLIGQDPKMAVPPADIGDYLQQMVNEWRANNPGVSTEGASSYVDATTWLRSKGFTVEENTMAANPLGWWAEMQHGILTQHCCYIVGVTNAQALPGDEAGVHNHGLAAVGIDSDGNIICADPDNWVTQLNMPGNPIGAFKTYGRQDFVNAQISSLTKVYPMTLNINQVGQFFTQNADGSWTCKQTSRVVHMGHLQDYQTFMQTNSALNGLSAFGLPLTDEFYPMANVAAQVFERRIRMYDPNRLWDNPPGSSGPCYDGHIDDPRLNAYIESDAALKAQLAAAKAALVQDAAEINTIIADTKTLQGAETTPAQ